MTGRFAQVLLKSALPAGLGDPLRDGINGHIQPRMNIAPSAAVATIAAFEGQRLAMPMLWGLIPNWKKDLAPPTPTNARIETVNESGMFKGAFRYRHCVIPVRNYYGWIPGTTSKQPYAIAHATDEALWLAGIHELWTDQGNSALQTFCFITKPATGIAAKIDERMPVILAPEHVTSWLASTDVGESFDILNAPPPPLAVYPVSKDLNNAKHEDPSLAEPIGEIEVEVE